MSIYNSLTSKELAEIIESAINVLEAIDCYNEEIEQQIEVAIKILSLKELKAGIHPAIKD